MIKIGQSEIIDLLEKEIEPVSLGEIAKILQQKPQKVSEDIRKLIKFKEVKYKEIDKTVALKKYHCKRRMRIYYV